MANVEILDSLLCYILTSFVDLRLGHFINTQMGTAKVSVDF